MSERIATYLARLREVLGGTDPAVQQDALADAEEHLRTALEQALIEEPGLDENAALEAIIEKYGSPEEIAVAYREVESRISPVFAIPKQPAPPRSLAGRIFGVLVEPRAYAAFLYMLFSMFTGIIYFTWAVTGLSMSAGFIVMIFGIPFFGVFLLSMQGLALVEGRLIEGMLGVRMPRRPIFSRRDLGVWERFKYLVGSAQTWKVIVYMMLKLPLGILSFTLAIVFFALALSGIFRPILEYGFDIPYAQFGNYEIHLTGWSMPFAVISGVFWLWLTLLFSKGFGKLHAGFARVMLLGK